MTQEAKDISLRWFDTQSAATILGVNVTTINRWCTGGRLRFVTRNKYIKGGVPRPTRRIPEAAIVEFLEKEWTPNPNKYPNAKPITLDFLIEYGLKSGAIQNIKEVRETGFTPKEVTKKKQLASRKNLKKAFEAKGMKAPDKIIERINNE